MNPTNGLYQDLSDLVECYEHTRAETGAADISQFAPPTDHPHYHQVVAELIRVDLEYEWQDGRRISTAEYRKRFPEVLAKRECLNQIAYEEYRLRRFAGEAVPRDEFSKKYGVTVEDWKELPVGDPNPSSSRGEDPSPERGARAARPGSQPPSWRAVGDEAFPKVGDCFLGFDLVGELGSGAFGRVYLARHGDLAKRFVALKVTAEASDEPQRLAQLQHTNIVPIYSLHEQGSLRAICMPFLGANSLADVLQTFEVNHSIPASGQAIVSTLAARQVSTLVRQTADRTVSDANETVLSQDQGSRGTIQRLGNMSYRDAAAWIMARVADGLAHAHEHGIVHRDLKPANILLSDDGEPLILDFNLSVSNSAASSSKSLIGGTLPYMAPEHIEAIRRGGEVLPQSDIYSLGVILFEMLTGRTPYPIHRGPFEPVTAQMLRDRQAPAPPVGSINKTVSPDLESIVSRCLAIDPHSRYETARQLHDDLQRHIDHRPLRYAPNRSLGERARKWARRHPRVSSSMSIATVSALIVLALATSLRLRSVELSQADSTRALHKLQSVVRDARPVLNTPFVSRATLDEAVRSVEQTANRHGFLRTADPTDWPDYESLDEPSRRDFRRAAVEVLYLLANSKAQQAVRDQGNQGHLFDHALHINELASQTDRDRSFSKGMLLQKARLLEASDRPQLALAARQQATKANVGDAHSQRLLAFESSIRHDFDSAASLLDELIQKAPEDYTLWFSLGNCHLQLRRYAEAAQYFSVAVLLQPEFTLGFDHRGFARLQNEEFADARRDFDIVLSRRPDLTATLVNRALASKGLDETGKAVADLQRALDQGAIQTRIHFLLARWKRELGDEAGAATAFEIGLRSTPRDEYSWVARGVAKISADPEAALADFAEAVKLNPRFQPAWQNIAHVHSQLNQTDKAIEAMDQLVDIDARDAGSLASRGVLLARLGERDEAITDATRALEISQDALLVYQVGCIYSLVGREHPGDAKTAIQFVAKALQDDAALVRTAMNDADLSPIREIPALQRVLAAARAINQAATAGTEAK